MKKILKYLSNNMTQEDKYLFEKQIQSNPVLVKRLNLFKLIFKLGKKQLKERDVDALWIHLQNRIEADEAKDVSPAYEPQWQRHHKPAFLSTAISFAAVLLFMAGGSYIVFKDQIHQKINLAEQEIAYETVKVKHGQRLNMLLSDGSKIYVDAGSEIRYPKVFKDTREVYLKGEAYFEVAHDSQRPFRVHANHALIRVHGTKFNVRAWDESPVVTVAVKEGKVSLSQETGSTMHSVFLTKNEMSTIEEDQNPLKATKTDIEEHMGWTRNEINFHSVKIKEVLAQLKRWYDFEYFIVDSSFLEQSVTVHIVKTNVNDVLELLATLTDMKVERDSNFVSFIPGE